MALPYLTTNIDFSADKVALKYKELWQVERVFRDVKSMLETRTVYHQRNKNIRGHVFLQLPCAGAPKRTRTPPERCRPCI